MAEVRIEWVGLVPEGVWWRRPTPARLAALGVARTVLAASLGEVTPTEAPLLCRLVDEVMTARSEVPEVDPAPWAGLVLDAVRDLALAALTRLGHPYQDADTDPLGDAIAAWHTAKHREHQLRQLLDVEIQQAHTRGVSQSELARVTGMSRMTIRAILGH